MALIRPFRALRPAPEAAARVASVPYDVVSTDEARALASGNPLSFLHVTRSEIDLPGGTDPYSPTVYEQAVRNFEGLKRSAPLILDDQPALYLYRLRMGTHEQTGLAACYSLDEYDTDRIKKHERTRRDKEEDRTRHIVGLRAQTGVVFLTYPASPEVGRIVARVCGGAPLYDITAEDGITHTVWKVEGDDVRAIVDAFGRIPYLYIADGHHRAASAARARQQLRTAGAVAGKAASIVAEMAPPETQPCDTFLAVAFPDDQVQILPYNRVVKDLAGASAEVFLDKLRKTLPVGDGAPSPSRQGLVSMYLAGKWYELDLAGLAPTSADRAETLDVSVLQARVIGPLLNVADVRTDKRIDFVGGARGTRELERLVDSGKAAVAFSMYPVSVTDLISIADAGGIMPPKSTWFEPKLRDGLIIHLI
jgi:uncharacterized protein (DUF1015 family)